MGIKQKSIIRILIGIVIFFIGIVFYGWWLTSPRQLSITTDKIEYQLGEPVKIFLKSDDKRPIFYAEGPFSSGCSDSDLPGCMIVSTKRPYAFYRFDSGDCPTVVGKYIKINPNTEFSTEWNQTLYEYFTSGLHTYPSEEGTYKVKCNYSTHRYNCLLFPGMEWYCIFRNPFFKYFTSYSSEFKIQKISH